MIGICIPTASQEEFLEKLKKRINAIFSYISESQNPEAILIFNSDRVDKNFFYLTELSGGVFENCGVLCEKDGRMFIFTTRLEEEAARSGEGYAEIVVYKDEKERNENLKKVLSKYKKIGICYNVITYSFYLHLRELFDEAEWIDVGKAFRLARMIKSQDEIDRIGKACAIVSEVADSIPGILKEGITELELSAEIDFCMKKKGAHNIAFKTIVAFAKNTSMPHYSGADVPLVNGDVVLVDFGAGYMGYSSDITRTYLTGKPGKDMLDLYHTVCRAQNIAFELIRADTSTDYVENEVRKFINSHKNYKDRFIHNLGHSIGLDVHDDSYPGVDFNKQFTENIVLTVEPGIYLPGLYGVRIEDDIVIKKDGCTVLTNAKKKPVAYEI